MDLTGSCWILRTTLTESDNFNGILMDLEPPLSFHSTGWFIGIPLLDYYNPHDIRGSIIPQLIINQPSFIDYILIISPDFDGEMMFS